MKKKIWKSVKIASIIVSASAAVFAGVYFIGSNSGDSSYSAVTNNVSSYDAIEGGTVGTAKASSVNAKPANEKTDDTTIEADTTAEDKAEDITSEDITVSNSEEKTDSKQDTSSEKNTTSASNRTNTTQQTTTVAQPVTQPTTQPQTVAQPTTQPQTQPVTQPQTQPAVTYTNVKFSNADGNSTTYGTLEEAKASISVPTLSDAEGNARAVANKTTYANYASQMLNLINEYRASNGLAALTYNDTLATAAMHRAVESAYSGWNMTAYENGTTKRHIRPNYEKASSIGTYYGITGNFGENYARFFQTPQEALTGWKNSSAHNKLLLSTSYSSVGIGVAVDSAGYYYWIAIFN